MSSIKESDIKREFKLIRYIAMGVYADFVMERGDIGYDTWFMDFQDFCESIEVVKKPIIAYLISKQKNVKKKKAVAKQSAEDKREDGVTWLKKK